MEAVLAHPFFAEGLTKEEEDEVKGRMREKVHAMEETKHREKVRYTGASLFLLASLVAVASLLVHPNPSSPLHHRCRF